VLDSGVAGGFAGFFLVVVEVHNFTELISDWFSNVAIACALFSASEHSSKLLHTQISRCPVLSMTTKVLLSNWFTVYPCIVSPLLIL